MVSNPFVKGIKKAAFLQAASQPKSTKLKRKILNHFLRGARPCFAQRLAPTPSLVVVNETPAHFE